MSDKPTVERLPRRQNEAGRRRQWVVRDAGGHLLGRYATRASGKAALAALGAEAVAAAKAALEGAQ